MLDGWSAKRFPSQKIFVSLKHLVLSKTLSYNFTPLVKTLRVELPNPSKQARWQQRSPAMAAGLTDHIWMIRELLTVVLVPLCTNT
jgi:hypothetical protein